MLIILCVQWFFYWNRYIGVLIYSIGQASPRGQSNQSNKKEKEIRITKIASQRIG